MEYIIHGEGSAAVAELVGKGVQITDVSDALDLMANAGARSIVVREEHLAPEFFRLSSRLAGDILQKFTNYRVRFAIVGDFSKYASKFLQNFIRESNATGQTIFMPTLEEALKRFGR
ncbi:MAG: DUF4180 domain-containing protein [Spirochaetes bacterium]|nr:DUF4180 domain-containing protein [Spirochaetota bacterium]